MRIARLWVLALVATSAPGQAAPVGTAFTYQGRLSDGATPATGSYDFQFILYNALAGGAQVGPILTLGDVAVTSGLFTVTLDFGAGFDGNSRFLEIRVRPGGSTASYEILGPRQELTPAANALFSSLTGDPAVQRRTVAPTCPAGQHLSSLAPDGTPTCADDVDTNSGGSVTSIAAGAGLTGGAITLSGTLAVSFAGTGAASSGARSDHDHDATYQARITGTCPPGFGVRHLNADGSIVCDQSGVLSGATLTNLGPVGGSFAISVTIGVDGLGLISSGIGALKAAHCNNTACTSATISTLDSTASVGWQTSVTIGADGLGLISYWDFTNSALKVAHCNNVACTSALLATLDNTADVGGSSSLTIGSDGLGLIAYLDNTNGDLKVAHCNDVTCSSATLSVIDAGIIVGIDPSLTIGADGLGLISYTDLNTVDLRVAHCDNVICSSATLSTLEVPGFAGFGSSIAIGADGLGLISYLEITADDLKLAHCSNVACSTATLSILDSPGLIRHSTSVSIGADGLGLISYYDDGPGDLKIAHCNNVACTTATLTTLDAPGDVGESNSLTIGADGVGLVAYTDPNTGSLKVAHCGNIPCSPFVARRP